MNIFKSFFVIALTALTFTLSAADTPDAELKMKSKVVQDHKVVVQLINLQQENTTLKLQSLDGDITYFQEIIRQHNGYISRLNLKNLKDGRYVLQVDQADISKIQVVLIRNGKVRLSGVNS